ncbi:MAG: ribonuclease H-like domain-containing protein [Candidatus Krumholzibacteriota bacterium]
MDLKKRLAQLDRLSRRPDAAVPTGFGAAVSGDPAETLTHLGLEEQTGPLGPFWMRSRFDVLPRPTFPLPELREFFANQAVPAPDPGEILFMDTETTGLAGGTGTIPFLVGVSWWAADGLETRQYFLPDPGHEAALLKELADLAAGFRVVATFNGASYDLPLLRTRARLNRREDPFVSLTGWDLLFPARRLWGNRLENCRQQTLEKEVCGLPRGAGDLEGSRIPQAWFDFLASGRPGQLPEVMTHNQRDMLGMAHLLLRVVEAARLVAPGTEPSADLDWRDGWALGRICEKRRDTQLSLACLETAVAAALRGKARGLGEPRFVADAVRILKRGGDWGLVEKIIRAGLAAGVDTAWLHREAAILYEHRLIDLPKALDHARKSGEVHRVDRLRKMMDRRATEASCRLEAEMGS